MAQDIIIDATHYGIDGATGVENYVTHVLPLVSRKLVEQGWRVRWVGHRTGAPGGMPAKVEWIHSPHTRFWGQLALRRLLKQEKSSWFFTPSGVPPLLYRGQVAVTVHDMSAYVSSESFSRGQRFRLKWLMKRAVRRAKVVFTPSSYSKEQIVKFWHLPEDRIFVTPLSFDIQNVTPEEVAHVNVAEPIVLYISRVEVKKNVGRIIEAFAALNHPTAQLVLAGKEGVGAEKIKEQVAALPEAVKNRIQLPGYITNGQREWLLQSASVFLVPGALEGFSLPLLEAFAHQVPAVCAQAGPLPEIGGEACLYANPDLTPEWTTALQNILNDQALRDRLKAAGRERVTQFTWERTATETFTHFS
jgi:glycosyltransferase involved in cell wall biosynthesis